MAATPGKNPNCRNSELTDPLRRSFHGGFHRRDTMSRKKFASFTDIDDKENREDQNESRQWRSVRSPVPSKSNKNFISTASKRENLLVERNEEEFSVDYLKTGLDSMMLKDFQSTTDVGDLVNLDLDPTFKISPRVSFSPFVEVWAPVDPDQSPSPSPPPYDSKVKYLSPRPRFLYYRKNNRMKLDIGDSSDMDDSEEEEEEEEEESDDDVSSSCEVTEANKGNKKKLHVSFTSPKFMALLIALALTYLCISSTDLATFAPLQFEGLTAYSFQIPFKVAKDKFDGYFLRLQYWFADVRSYILAKVSGLRRRDHVPVSVTYADLRSLPEYNMIDDSDHKFSELEDRNMEELEVEANVAYKDTETRFCKPGNNEVYVHHGALIEEHSSTEEEEEIRGIEAEKFEVIDHPPQNETEGEHESVPAENDMASQGYYLVSEDMLGDLVSHATEPQSEESIDEDLYSEISSSGTEPVSEVFSDKLSRNYYYILPIISLLVLVLIVHPITKLGFLRNGKPSRTSPPQELSFEKGSSRKNEVESSRGEAQQSIAYSDSPSYGSFTTYERISNKPGVDEEIATPVRRSSRIRNRIASS